MKRKITKSINRIFKIFDKKGFADKIKLFFIETIPSYSCLFGDHEAYFSLYHHQREMKKVPTFILNTEGDGYRFLKEDLDAIIANSKEVSDIQGMLNENTASNNR